MKKILLGLLLLAGTAHAQFNDTQRSFGVPNNALTNPGFEGGLAGWVKSGGNWSLSGSANAAEGKNALAMEFTAADQTLKSALTSIPRSVVAKYGGSCEASFVYLGGGGNTYEYYVENSSSTVVGGYTSGQTMFQITADASGDYVRPYTMTFLCDEDETYRIVIKNKTASTQTIYIDNASMGGNTNIGSVAQAKQIGAAYFATTGSCSWSRTSTALGDFTSTAACPGPTVEFNSGPGVISTTDTNLPEITISNLPAGEYQVLVSGVALPSAAAVTDYKVSDGTTTSGAGAGPQVAGARAQFVVLGNFSYSSAGSRTFKMVGAASSGNVVITNQSGNESLKFVVTRLPSASETIARLDAPGVGWTAFTPTGSWSTNTTYAGYYQCDAGNLDMLVRVATSGAPTSATFSYNLPTNFTIDTAVLTGASSSSAVGQVVIEDSGTNTFAGWARINSSTSIGVNALQISGAAGSYVSNNGSWGVTQAIPMTWASGDTMTIRARVPVTASSPCPKSPQVLIPGSVYSPSSGVERIYRAKVTTNCTSSPCTIASQSGNWLTNITRASTGLYSANFASTLSADTTCIVTCVDSNNPTTNGCAAAASNSTSLLQIFTKRTENTTVDSAFSIICMGPN